MRISLAQIQPVPGDIVQNIAKHQKLIDAAVALKADLIVFPELSLTGYEPTLANALATTPGDKRFDDFQKTSNHKKITIGVGMPIRFAPGSSIGMILFQPGNQRKVYLKKYIHADEEPYFVSGENPGTPLLDKPEIALAICYELSIPLHAEYAFKNGAEIYIASVAKSINGVEKALQRLSEIARSYSMLVLMANCIGPADGVICAGRTSIWNRQGELIGQLDEQQQGLLLIDTETHEVQAKYTDP